MAALATHLRAEADLAAFADNVWDVPPDNLPRLPAIVILWDSETVTINTTPRGVADGLLSSMPGPRGALLDVVYHPWPTQLARYWQEFGQVEAI